MATLRRQEIIEALTRLGELAQAEGQVLRLLMVGGGVMVLEFNARQSTRDVDVAVLGPGDAASVRAKARKVAAERDWPDNWLNDAAKGYLVGRSEESLLFAAPGIEVLRPSYEQLLAMKLCAWRDDVDIADARKLLQQFSGTYDEVWRGVAPYLQPGRELKAQYAFGDLWEDVHGSH